MKNRTTHADKSNKSAPGRPRKGKELSEVTSIRLEPTQKVFIKRLFGSVQNWIDHCIDVLNQTKGK
jgi:hypothetical protein